MNNIDNQLQKIASEVKKLEEMGGSFSGKAKRIRESTFMRFPVLLLLLSTFGLVATLYGFEKVIDEIPFFAKNPLMILLAGLVSLTITGKLFKKLK